jgi:DNA-binding CsgD family transcriptional regulator
VSIADGSAAVDAHFLQLQRGAQEEILTFDRPPYPTSGGTVPNPLVADNAARGVVYRTVYDSALMSEPPWAARVQADIEHGAAARVMDGVPLKLAISDRSMAMVPLQDADPVRGLTALVVRPSVLLDSLVELFEALWQRAVPLRLDAEGVPGVDVAVVEVTRLLASGMSDSAIARHCSTSERTVRRRVAEAMEALGATTRYQLGMLAERKGWLGE